MPDRVQGDSGADVGLLDPLGAGARRLTNDAAWLAALVEVELALTRALIDAELAPEWMAQVADSLADALTDPLADPAALDLQVIARESRGGGNPVIPLVKHLGRAAEHLHEGASDHLHVGATSQDILDTAAMVIASRVGGAVLDELDKLADRLAELADAHRSTPMAGRTLGQQAAPTSFGLVAASWLSAVLTARKRIEAVLAELPAQYGGAVGNLAVLTEVVSSRRADAAPAAAGAVVDDVRAAFASRLGLRSPEIDWHTDRTPVVAFADALAGALGAVGAFALDVTVLARTEIGEVTERLGAGEGGSSAMPHKRNPVTAVLIVSAARRAPGLVSTMHGSMLAEDQRPSGAWHAEWQALRDLEEATLAATMAAASLAGRLEIDDKQMRANLELTDGLIFSERVSAILAESLGQRTAFDLVEAASREAVDTRRPLRVVLTGSLSTSGADEQLRQRVWNAFEPDSALGHAERLITQVLEKYSSERQK
jgi:3-carboxy-cis,cis-muconate cycloisomerase